MVSSSRTIDFEKITYVAISNFLARRKSSQMYHSLKTNSKINLEGSLKSSFNISAVDEFF